jgi:PAS domain S-box-containing protein
MPFNPSPNGNQTSLDFLRELSVALRLSDDPSSIQRGAARALAKYLSADDVKYADSGEDVLGTVGDDVAAVREDGKTRVVHDVSLDPRLPASTRLALDAAGIKSCVSTGVVADGTLMATLTAHSATPRAWTPTEVAVLEEAAERTWSAVQHARVKAALRESEERRTFMIALGDVIRPLTDPAAIVTKTCRLLGTHLGVNRVAYGEIDGDQSTVLDDYVDGVASMAGRFRWAGFAGSIVDEFKSGATLVVNDTGTDPRTAQARDALKAAEIGAYLCPLLIKDGRFVAAFGIHSRTPRVWTTGEITLARAVADRVFGMVEQRRAEAALRANEERLAFLLRLNDALRPLSDPLDVEEAAARLTGEHLRVNRVGYAEIDGKEYIIRREYVRGVPPLAGQGPTGTFGAALRDAYRRGETVVVNDISADPRLTEPERAAMQARQMAAFIGVTLVKNGRLVAAFGANNATPRLWTPAEIALVSDVAERTWEAVERARTEAALREREWRLRLALDASAAGSWTRDALTGETDWDDRFRKRYGLSPDTPASFDTWIAYVHDEDRAGVLSLLDEVLRTRKDSWDTTFRVIRTDGTVLWIQSVGRADRDSSGQVVRLTGLELDVTERRLAEESLKARRDEEHDRQMRLLLETAAQGIVLLDSSGAILTSNRAIESMFGWTPGELIGQPIERLVPVSRPHADVVARRKDGSTFPIELSVNHVATSEGGRTIAFVTDVTERRRAAAALQERTSELERRTAQLSQLASDLTLAEQHAREELAKTVHDGLQQLLAVAATHLALHIRRDSQTGVPAELLTQAKSELDEAIDAARSLSFELHPPLLHGSGLPAALAWLAQWTHQKYGLEVEISADPLADSTRKDIRTLLFESVRELLFNVFKHAQVSRVTVDLTLDANDMLCITVADEGIGFDPVSVVERAKAGQVGWGLFSIRERLTLLGGRFDIESTPGQGTRFRLIAPHRTAHGGIGVQDASSRAADLHPSSGAAGVASPRPLRILIVDDQPMVLRTFRKLLQERTEFLVVGDAANGLEAIARTRTLRPDVVLMDISMPLLDGVEATRRLRAEFPSICVLGLSAQPQTEERHPIEEAGASAFFNKGTGTAPLIEHLLVLHATTLGMPGPSV